MSWNAIYGFHLTGGGTLMDSLDWIVAVYNEIPQQSPIFYEIFRCGMKLMPSGCCSSVTLTGREDGDECRAEFPPPISPCSRLNHKGKLDFYATIYRYCIHIDFHWILLTISSFNSPSNKKHKQNLLNKRIQDVPLFLGFWAAVPQHKRFKR